MGEQVCNRAAEAADSSRPTVSNLREIFGGRNFLLVIGLALSFTSTWLINTAVYPLTDPFAPQTQFVAPLVGALVALGFAFACQHHPRLFSSRATMVTTLVVTECMSALFYVSALWVLPALALVAGVVRWITCILRDIVLGFALIDLSASTCVGVLVSGYALRYVLGSVLSSLSLEVQMVAFMLCFPVGLVLLWTFARPAFERLNAGSTPAELSITNPLSFLPLTSRMFAIVILFHAALGFSVTFGGKSAAAFPGTLIALAFFLGLLVVTLVRGVRSIDWLYGVAYLFALAGVLLVPALSMGEGDLTGLCSIACEVSASLFALVLWYMVARIGARSLAGALPVMCMVRSARGAGLALGLISGAAATELGDIDGMWIALFVAAMAFVFAAYNFMFTRSFSFDDTVRGVHPLDEPQAAPEAVGQAEGTRLEDACAALAAECKLTARESEVLALLARGRNAAYIQDELCLTRNTVKSYVADVYRKMGVHSHQELIDLVEAGSRG